MRNDWLKYLIAIAAFMIAGSAAYFSVTGLAVLFSGAAIAVMVMAGSLEFAKLVTATYLKQKWSEIQGINKWYLTISVVILMTITSAGIFGYLSNAFQQQNIKLEQVQREIDVWNNKITSNTSQITNLTTQLTNLQQNQGKLLDNKVNNRLLKSIDNRDKQTKLISDKISSLQDSNVVYNGHINEIKNNNINLEKEVGGFRFVAQAFNVPLNSVVKFFIILIVIVFDPLAIALVIAFNQLVLDGKPTGNENKPIKDTIDTDEVPLILSKNDLEILEKYIFSKTPVEPNEALKEGAKKYEEEVNQKPWSNLPDEVWERMQKYEAQREALHGPVLPEDEPTGALANSGPREKGGLDNDYKVIKETYRDPIGEMIQNNQDMGLYDEPFDNPMIDEEFSTIEPSIDEEEQNFSTIETNIENIYQENEELIIPIDESVDNEPELTFEEGQLPDDMLQVLNDVETETFSNEPTTLDVVPEEDNEKKNL